MVAAPTVILAAHLGHAFQWRRFKEKLAEDLARETFLIFHAKDFKARAGEFRGWSDAQCDRLGRKLTNLVSRAARISVRRELKCPVQSRGSKVERANSVQCARHDLLYDHVAETPTLRRRNERSVSLMPMHANFVGRLI